MSVTRLHKRSAVKRSRVARPRVDHKREWSRRHTFLCNNDAFVNASARIEAQMPCASRNESGGPDMNRDANVLALILTHLGDLSVEIS